jgi:mevalonate kinase
MYPAKILLFGEYSILLNSDALAIPFNRFSGELALMDSLTDCESQVAEQSNRRLKELFIFINQPDISKRIEFSFDNESFRKDLERGLWFKSDIPEESGLGSSGALAAAIFDRYSDLRTSNTDLLKIKYCLALIESAYHGNSSGIDPLVSYLKTPVLIQGNNIGRVSGNQIDILLHEYGFFLVKFKQSGKTGGLVKKFNARCKSEPGYLNRMKEEYTPLNDECILSLSKPGDNDNFFSAVRRLSELQLELFSDMIPGEFIPLIYNGLENNMFYLKLCGSGGGGYFLGFTKNISETERYFKSMGYPVMIY